MTQSQAERMTAEVNAHPDHLYNYSPANTPGDTRYVFTDRTCTSLTEAWMHLTELPAQEQKP